MRILRVIFLFTALALSGCENDCSTPERRGLHEVKVLNETTGTVSVTYACSAGVLLPLHDTTELRPGESDTLGIYFDCSGTTTMTAKRGEATHEYHFAAGEMPVIPRIHITEADFN
ncbi:MAG TPA: hypothetical protein DCZ95_08915 [Verrucomicrobia bacterium]|nr:MAG: hypothetical protein A2X46_03105 [Lentisphaerae bacterium GWF2_57_35]HBA84197.1 hypothetical protein [Verrucomicrobiota bacterium]